MKSGRIAAPIAAAFLTLGLTACGGGGGSEESGSSTPSNPTQKTTSESPDAAGLTPPGTTLKVGQEATVAWVPPSEYSVSGGQKGIELAVTVEAIEKGGADDFAAVELDPELESATPYYVKLRIEAIGSYQSDSADDPDVTPTAIDDRGQEQSSLTFIGDFPPCTDEEVPKPFKSGDSYESCVAYAMPGGGSIEKVEWASGPSEADELTPYFDEPVVWEGS